jgi:hypothetical protein
MDSFGTESSVSMESGIGIPRTDLPMRAGIRMDSFVTESSTSMGSGIGTPRMVLLASTDGKRLSEQEVEALLKPEAPSCEGQTVIVNGREYVLVEKVKK